MSPLLAIPRKRPAALHGSMEALSCIFGRSREGSGDEERIFEREFAEYVGGEFGIATSGARVGLWALLQGWKERYGPGEVILPALTASIVPNVVLAAGFQPVFVDVHEDTFTAGPQEILPAMTRNTRAVIATHLEGFPVRVDEIKKAVADAEVLIIEDAAHALGARIMGKPVGSLGDAAVFSLGKGKQLNAISGGMVTTHDSRIEEDLRGFLEGTSAPPTARTFIAFAVVQAMRWATFPGIFDLGLWPGIRACAATGRDPLVDLFEDPLTPPGPEGPAPGAGCLGALRAVLGLHALRAYPPLLARRIELWKYLRNAAHRAGIPTQLASPGTQPAPLEFAIRTKNRAHAQAWLRAKGVDSQPTWMVAPSGLPALRENSRGEYKNSEALAAELLYIPFYPSLREDELDRLVATLENPVHGICP